MMTPEDIRYVLAKHTGQDQYLISGHYVFTDEAEAMRSLRNLERMYDTVLEIPKSYLDEL